MIGGDLKIFQDEEIVRRVIKAYSIKAFDGDILNMIALIQPEFVKMFRKFDPLKKYIMSRRDGSLNKLFAIGKGQLVDLYEFATFKDEEGLDELDEEKLQGVIETFEKRDRQKPIYLPSGKIMMVD